MKMCSKQINKKLINEEEDDNDLIINTDDFCMETDQKNNQKKNLEIKVEYNQSKEQEVPPSSQKIEITNDSKSNEVSTNKNIFIPVPNPQILNTNNSKEPTGEEKTIFSKITEDLYLDNKLYLQPKKAYFDIGKANEDNYNKLTIENYLFTCADKENSKNNKIINDFLERKTKELNNKKIGSDPERDDSENFVEIKGLCSDRKKEKGTKYQGRSPEQFIKEQKILEQKHKSYIDNLVKKYNEEEKTFIKDRPTIDKQSEKIAKMKNSGNKDIHLKLYEDYNDKKQKIEEKFRKIYIVKPMNKYKKIDNNQVMQKAKKLHNDYEKRINTVNENKIKQLNDIKNMSAVSLVQKKSNIIIYKKLINNYKNIMKIMFNKDISDKFDINYYDYLTFIYKLDLTDKNYNPKNKEVKNINISTNNNIAKNLSNIYNNFDTERYNNDNIKNKIIFSKNILKRNTYFKSKSVEKNKISEETELKTIKNSWKIITKNKSFSESVQGNTRRILLFLLSVYGIYKGDLNDDFIKKELPFLSQVDDKMYYIEINLATQIYKYFHIFRNNAMNNISLKNKEKEKERRLTHDKSENIIRFQNLKTNRDSKGNIITIECNNEKNLVKKNKQIFSGSKSTKKMAVFQKLNNNIFKKQTLNDKIINKNIIEKKKTISKNENKENITYANKNNNKRYSNNKENENILNNSEQINLNNLKKNLKPKKETIMKKKLNLNKGMLSNSTKNINIKMNKNIISNKNNNSNNDIKIDNINNNINKNEKEINKYAQKKIKENKNILSPILSHKIENQNIINPNSLLKKEKDKDKEKDKIILNNKIQIKEQEKEKKENIENVPIIKENKDNNEPIIKENNENVPIIKEKKENVAIIKENINSKENEQIIKEEQNQVRNQIIEENKVTNENKETKEIKENKEIIAKTKIINHEKEKNSSISNYIFKEDYRIKEDIESNSNFNILEGSMKNDAKRITSQNFTQSDFHIENNEDIDKYINNNKLTNVNINNINHVNEINNINNINEEQINNIEPKQDNNINKKRKSKFIFKINIKKRLIKLIINKGDDVESKIDAFCKENDLDEDDKEEIVQAINANLKI